MHVSHDEPDIVPEGCPHSITAISVEPEVIYYVPATQFDPR